MQRGSKKVGSKADRDHSARVPRGLAPSIEERALCAPSNSQANAAPLVDKDKQADAGSLWVVATPIGNLEDISPRALRCLAQAHCIYCEDTRTSAALLRHYGIQTATRSLHEHNETARISEIVELLQRGLHVALISDAGTPLISDPGYPLIAKLRELALPVYAVPGPSALIAALSVAGIACQRFAFEGFLPAAGAARRELLQRMSLEDRTVVFYESSHRIEACLADCEIAFGAIRRASVIKEISKHFERAVCGTFAEIRSVFAQDSTLQRGEFVVVVEAGNAVTPEAAQAIALMQTLMTELAPAQAARLSAKFTGLSKRSVYALMQSGQPETGSPDSQSDEPS